MTSRHWLLLKAKPLNDCELGSSLHPSSDRCMAENSSINGIFFTCPAHIITLNMTCLLPRKQLDKSGPMTRPRRTVTVTSIVPWLQSCGHQLSVISPTNHTQSMQDSVLSPQKRMLTIGKIRTLEVRKLTLLSTWGGTCVLLARKFESGFWARKNSR